MSVAVPDRRVRGLRPGEADHSAEMPRRRPSTPERSGPSTAAPGARASRPILLAVVAGALAMGVLASVAWRLDGGSVFTIGTPSMCPDLCVGTLVFDRPLAGPVRPGMVVSFRPPGSPDVYTHRVVKVLADGSIKTAGDALGRSDPWTVPRSRIVGRVVGNIRGVGWLWRCLPAMTAALACYLLVRFRLPRWLRTHVDVVFVTLLVAAPALLLRPLLRAEVIALGHPRHGVVIRVVNTGLLPAQFHLGGGSTVAHVSPGQIVTLGAPHSSDVWFAETPSIPSREWAIAGLVCALAMLAVLARLAWAQSRANRPVAGRRIPSGAGLRAPAGEDRPAAESRWSGRVSLSADTQVAGDRPDGDPRDPVSALVPPGGAGEPESWPPVPRAGGDVPSTA